MSNRHQRRAAQAQSAKLPPFPEMPDLPNMSGTEECCGNCRFSVNTAVYDEIVETQIKHHEKLVAFNSSRHLPPPQYPAPQKRPPDETWCIHDPQQVGKKVWGWCSRWKARDGFKSGG